MSLPRRLVITAFLGALVMGGAPPAMADHEGPERVVDGKYVVWLSLFPQGDAMTLRFFFRDRQTGKLLREPVSGSVTILDVETQALIVPDARFTTDQGKGDVSAMFPRDGLYSIALTFQTADAPEVRHRPEAWETWMPGLERGTPPALGVSEWLGLAMAGGVVVLLAFSALQRRNRKRTV